MARPNQAVRCLPENTGGKLDRVSSDSKDARAPAGRRDILDFVFAKADIGICITDRNGTIIDCNASFASLLGREGGTLSGLLLSQLIWKFESTQSAESAPAQMHQIMRGMDWVVRRPDGTARSLVIKGWAFDQDDPNSVLCFTVSDVTGRKQAEVALMRARDEAEVASRAKSSFLANMSHELRTPLNAIIGFSEIIESQFMGPLGEPRYLEYVTDIHRSANHLLEIINNILDISKIEAGRLELHEESIEVGKLLDSCINLIRERALRHGVSLEVHADDTLPLLLADATKLRQILINLLSNAVKFTPEGGHVTVSAYLDSDNQTAVKIADTGIGMTEDELELAMEPFGQVDSDLARRFEGTGLGLPLSKALVDLHGGRLVLTSEQGVGTTALVTFPVDRSVLLPALFGGS